MTTIMPLATCPYCHAQTTAHQAMEAHRAVCTMKPKADTQKRPPRKARRALNEP